MAQRGRPRKDKTGENGKRDVGAILSGIVEDSPAYRVKGYLDEAKKYVGKWREQAEICDKFVAGHQWEDEQIAVLKEQQKPYITINRMDPIINVVSGTEIQNRQTARCIPRDPAQADKAGAGDLATNGIVWALENCGGEYERSVAFKDLLRRGLAYTQASMDYETDPNGKFVLKRIDGMEMWSDPWAREQNLGDARWFNRRRLWHAEEVYDRWPDAKGKLPRPESMGLDAGLEGESTGVRYITATRYLEGGTKIIPGQPESGPKGMIMVNECEWYETEPFYRMIAEDLPEGLLDAFELDLPQPAPEPGMDVTYCNLTEDEWSEIKKTLEQLGEAKPPNTVKLNRRVWKKAFTSGSYVFEETDLAPNMPTFLAMTDKWDDEDKIWRGMAWALIDPQKGSNKWFSQGLYVFAANPKGSVLAEANSFKDPDRAAMDWANPGAIIHLKQGALQSGKIKVEPPPPFPEAVTQMVQYAITAFRDVSGINMDLLGNAEGQSDPAAQRNQTQGLTILASLFDSFTRYRHSEALTVLEYLREYLSDGRWIRVGGPDDSQYLQLLKDDLFLSYDILIDDSPRNPNQKKEVWDSMQPIIPTLLQKSGGTFPEPLMDYLPMPSSVIAKLKSWQAQQSQQQAQQPPGPPPKLNESPEYIQAMVQKIMAEAQLETARAQAIKVESQIGSLETLQDIKLQDQGSSREDRAQRVQTLESAAKVEQGAKQQEVDQTEKLASAAAALKGNGGGDENTLNQRTAIRRELHPKSPGGI